MLHRLNYLNRSTIILQQGEICIMMYIHYCKSCARFHILNGHKQECPACESSLTEMQIPYLEFVELSTKERNLLMDLCKDEKSLKELSTSYRMYKYSKWYRERQKNAC